MAELCPQCPSASAIHTNWPPASPAQHCHEECKHGPERKEWTSHPLKKLKKLISQAPGHSVSTRVSESWWHGNRGRTVDKQTAPPPRSLDTVSITRTPPRGLPQHPSPLPCKVTKGLHLAKSHGQFSVLLGHVPLI